MAKREKEKNCGDCTACCDGWVNITVAGVDVYPGSPCVNSIGGAGGCRIYADRPQARIEFECAWLQSTADLPDWLRPDDSKVLLKNLDWFEDTTVLFTLPVGRKVPPRTLNYLKEFSDRYQMPLVYAERVKEKRGFGPELIIDCYGPPQIENKMVRVREIVTRDEVG